MRVLLVAAFAFAIGTAVGSRWSVYHSTLTAKLTDLLAQTPGKCADVLAGKLPAKGCGCGLLDAAMEAATAVLGWGSLCRHPPWPPILHCYTGF